MNNVLNIELVVLNDGGVILAGDDAFPDIVKRVEYYREQKLFLLIYKNGPDEGDLTHFEVPTNLVYPVEKSPDIIIMSLYKNESVGYKVPLIKVGNLY